MSSAPALSRPLAPRALRTVSRRFAVAVAACLTLSGASSLSAQNPGELDANQPSNAPKTFTYYSQLLLSGSAGSRLLVSGDRFGLFALDPQSGTVLTNGAFDYTDINVTGSPGRIVYTAVSELIPTTPGLEKSILIGGLFGRSAFQINDKKAAQNIQRLLSNGRLDPDFDPGRGANDYVTSIVPLDDGGMIVGGVFDKFNGQDHEHIVRLNAGGGIVDDATFDSDLAFDASVITMAEQTESNLGVLSTPQYIVGGQFESVNGVSHPKLTRINRDGTVDGSFNPNFDARVTIIYCQAGGKIIVGGDFLNVNGQSASHIVRLNYDGSIDPTFVASVTGQPPYFSTPPAVYLIKPLADGRLYLAGTFNTVNGVTRRYVARVSADGVLDTSFNASDAIINAVQSLTIQPADGKLLVGENLSQTNGTGVRPPALVRLYAEPPVTTLNLKAKAKRARVTPAKQGIIRLRRSNNVSGELPYTVNVTISGSAIIGDGADSDVKSLVLPGGKVVGKPAGDSVVSQITFPANVDTVFISVVPNNKTVPPQGVTVTLTLADAANQEYSGPNSNSATVTVRNN